MFSILLKYRLQLFSTLIFLASNFILSTENQYFISFVLIFTFGLIHGANDIQLIQKKTLNYNVNFFIYSILVYVSVVILGILIFFYVPKFGLIFFVFFSSFHFGEQHLGSFDIESKNILIKGLLYTSYGSIILGLLFSLQWLDTHVIVFEISELFISKKTMEIYFYISFITFFIISLFYKNFRRVLLIETVLIIFLGFFFSKASLLLSFSVYFVFWHSIPSILDQLNFLYDSDNSRKKRYFLSSLPYWIMSILGLFVFYFNFHTNPKTFLPLFFSFLAAITFPHTIVMGWLEIYKTKSKIKK